MAGLEAALYAEGDRRYEEEIPPDFKDVKKPGARRDGDWILRSMMSQARRPFPIWGRRASSATSSFRSTRSCVAFGRSLRPRPEPTAVWHLARVSMPLAAPAGRTAQEEP